MTEEDKENKLRQLVVSGILGDGHLKKSGALNYSSVVKPYMEYKKDLAGEYARSLRTTMNGGYKKAEIHSLIVGVNPIGKEYVGAPLQKVCDDLDELGLVLWLYDDGSLHKTSHFYNINTHAYSLEDQENILIPTLRRFGIYAKILKERKKDGREFNYLYVPKYSGAFEINELLKKYPVEGYMYKTFDNNVLYKYQKLKERFKGASISGNLVGQLLYKYENFEESLETFVLCEDGIVRLYKNKDKRDIPKNIVLI